MTLAERLRQRVDALLAAGSLSGFVHDATLTITEQLYYDAEIQEAAQTTTTHDCTLVWGTAGDRSRHTRSETREPDTREATLLQLPRAVRVAKGHTITAEGTTYRILEATDESAGEGIAWRVRVA